MELEIVIGLLYNFYNISMYGFQIPVQCRFWVGLDCKTGMTSMNIKNNGWIKFLLGFVMVMAILSGVVAFMPGYIATYGATGNEVSAIYPGDEILTRPVIVWTHGWSISASPEKVWPWIAQIGQSRGGFYSYTFIENLISRDGSYQNAMQVLEQYQDPKPGIFIIKDMLPIKDVKKGEYLLAAVDDFYGMGWTWGWYLRPEGINSSRLIIRMKIQVDGEQANPVMFWMLNAGGFVMEKAMLRGISDRAEGRPFPAPNEIPELIIWVGTLVVGLASAWQMIRQKKWFFPLMLGLTSLASLLVFTFVQPNSIWRILILILLILAYWGCVKWDKNPEEREQK